MQRTVTCTKELLEGTVDSLKTSTSALVNSLAVPSDNEGVRSLMKEFESARNALENIDNPYKMTKFFESEFSQQRFS